MSIDSYKCRSTVTSVDRQLQVSIDSYKCRSTVISVDRQLQVSIDSYKCRSTVISVGRQLSFSTVVSVDVQLLTVNGQLLTVQEKK